MQNELISELVSPVQAYEWGVGAPGSPTPFPLKFFRAVYKIFSAILETLQD